MVFGNPGKERFSKQRVQWEKRYVERVGGLIVDLQTSPPRDKR